MKELFKDILKLEGIKGLILFSFGGELIFKEFLQPLQEAPEAKEWWGFFFSSLDGIREAELVFENSRLYIRKTEVGYLLVLTARMAPVALMRLNCDMLLPVLKEMKGSKALRRFLKKK